MYKFNCELIIREDDQSIFSLEEMEIYEFNEAGFNAILLIRKAGSSGISFQDWEKQTRSLPNFTSEDLDEFWDTLIEHNIIIEA